MKPFSHDQEIAFENSSKCHISTKPFVPDEIKIKYHFHFTGNYRGAARNTFNISYKDEHNINDFFIIIRL